MTNNRNETRRLTARRIIEDKIQVLREFVETQPPSGTFIPKTIRQFREWEDANNNLKKIGSPGTLNLKQSPHNRDLIEEVQDLLRKIKCSAANPRRKQATLSKQLEVMKRDLDIQTALTASLASQLHQTRDALKLAESNEKIALLARERADETIAELRRKIIRGSQQAISLVKE